MTRDELEALVRLHQAELYRYVRYLGAASSAVAEDVIQETFLAAFKSNSPPRNPEPRVQAAWLRGIARNLFLVHCRRQRTNPVRTDSDSVERAEAVWTGEFLRGGDGFDYVEALRGCMGRLAERQREMLDLQYAQGKSRAEIASLCKMSEDGIKSFMRRTRSALGDCIKRRLAESAQT